MKRSPRMVALMISFTLVASMANATNFSKNDNNKNSSNPAAPAGSPVKTEASVKPEVSPQPEAAPKPESSPTVGSPVRVEPPVKVMPPAKVGTPAKVGIPTKPELSDKPFEVQTADRTMLLCPDGYGCVKAEGADYKCVPDKTKSAGGYGEICKTTPRQIPAAEPVQKDSGLLGRKK